ncbi:hypothetical protein ANN_01655 [Periplaneta americana]|uniref:Reverse transcriptase n=1 Tax=Periplaneta americana TaxID=6978 RepID=A0ABQ8TU48_PERAM|nr:hypothetical protein ANN_01655 [Periplaneta americana]
MIANVRPVRALPGRSQNGTHCRHCRSEKETLAHILGACPHGEQLRNSRHHKIRSLLPSALRGKDYQVEEEVHEDGLPTAESLPPGLAWQKAWKVRSNRSMNSSVTSEVDSRADRRFIKIRHLYKVNRLQIRNDYKQGGLRLTAVSNKAQAIMMRHFITTLHGRGDPEDVAFWSHYNNNNHITITQVPYTWNKAATTGNAQNGFSSCWIYPYDADVVREDGYTPTLPEAPSNPPAPRRVSLLQVVVHPEASMTCFLLQQKQGRLQHEEDPDKLLVFLLHQRT